SVRRRTPDELRGTGAVSRVSEANGASAGALGEREGAWAWRGPGFPCSRSDGGRNAAGRRKTASPSFLPSRRPVVSSFCWFGESPVAEESIAQLEEAH